MKQLCCDTARHALETRDFTGWHGLPAGCTPEALFGVALDDQWGQRRLGADHEPVRSCQAHSPRWFAAPSSSVLDGRSRGLLASETDP